MKSPMRRKILEDGMWLQIFILGPALLGLRNTCLENKKSNDLDIMELKPYLGLQIFEIWQMQNNKVVDTREADKVNGVTKENG